MGYKWLLIYNKKFKTKNEAMSFEYKLKNNKKLRKKNFRKIRLMKISILLPYKENYSHNYAGAVSLFVYDTTKISKFRKNIRIFGSTDFKSTLSKNYTNIELKKNSLFQSQSRFYVNKFIEFTKKY